MNNSLNTICETPDLLVLTGSRLYGCHTENSDYDYRGFVVPPFNYLVGREHFSSYTDPSVSDIVVYSALEFIRLLEKGSPNIIEILYAPEQNIKNCTVNGRLLIANRRLFLHSGLMKAFFNFSRGMQQRMFSGITSYSHKDAYHTIRVLSQAYELYSKGKITYPLENREFLKEVKYGKASLKDVKDQIKYFEDYEKDIIKAFPDIKENKSYIDMIYYSLIVDKFPEKV